MSCEQVFFVLTRVPPPSGASHDEFVEDHLSRCATCWQLAEALRPAQDLFEEAMPAAEGRELPGYWGDARPPCSVLADVARDAQQSGRIAMAVRARTPRAMLVPPPPIAARPGAIPASAIAVGLLAGASAAAALWWLLG